MTEPLLTVAFIVMITAFFKKQLGLTGWKVLLAAFVVALVVAYLPLVAVAIPAATPWLLQLLQVIVLFLSAAGSVDFLTLIRTTDTPAAPGIK